MSNVLQVTLGLIVIDQEFNLLIVIERQYQEINLKDLVIQHPAIKDMKIDHKFKVQEAKIKVLLHQIFRRLCQRCSM